MVYKMGGTFSLKPAEIPDGVDPKDRKHYAFRLPYGVLYLLSELAYKSRLTRTGWIIEQVEKEAAKHKIKIPVKNKTRKPA